MATRPSADDLKRYRASRRCRPSGSGSARPTSIPRQAQRAQRSARLRLAAAWGGFPSGSRGRSERAHDVRALRTNGPQPRMGRDDPDVDDVRAVSLDECSVARVVKARLLTNEREDDPRPVRCPGRLRRALLGPAERCEGFLGGAIGLDGVPGARASPSPRAMSAVPEHADPQSASGRIDGNRLGGPGAG